MPLGESTIEALLVGRDSARRTPVSGPPAPPSLGLARAPLVLMIGSGEQAVATSKIATPPLIGADSVARSRQARVPFLSRISPPRSLGPRESGVGGKSGGRRACQAEQPFSEQMARRRCRLRW